MKQVFRRKFQITGNTLEKLLLLLSAEAAISFVFLIIYPRYPEDLLLGGFSLQLKFLIISWFMLNLILTAAAIFAYRRPQPTSQFADSLTQVLQNNIQLAVICLTVLLIFLVGVNATQSGSFLFEAYVNYLPRILPILWFIVVVSGQILIFLILVKLNSHWALFLLFSFGYIFIASSLLPRSERSFRLYVSLFPLISLAGIYLWSRLTQSLSKINLPKGAGKVLFAGIQLFLMGGAAFAYHSAANVRAAETNRNYTVMDQRAYLRFSKEVYFSNFKFTGDRGRMPVYPFLQALFFDPSLNDDEYFSQGKILNINLSIVLLLLLHVLFRKFLAIWPAVLLTLIIAFTLFFSWVAFFHAMLLYFFMIFLSYLLMSLMIIRPSIKLGVTMGIVVGLTQLTKASVLPGLAIFLAIFLMKESVHLYCRLNPKLAENESLVGAFRKRFISVLVAVVTFLIVMFPYIRESKLIYGQYFYNANQNFYPWYDSWEQAKADPLYKVIRDQAPDFSSFELPSLRKYLREHTPLQIFERIRDGVQHQYFLSLRQGILFNYSYLLLFSLGFLAVFNWQGTSELLREHKYLILFMVSFLSGYFLLFSWYTVISEEPRFLLSLQIVFLFSMFVGIRVFSQRFPRMTVFREAIDTKNLINFVYTNLTLMIMVDTYFTLTVGLLIRR